MRHLRSPERKKHQRRFYYEGDIFHLKSLFPDPLQTLQFCEQYSGTPCI
jgi:hypothetical protein